MTNKDILQIAQLQSAIDCSCAYDDFTCGTNKVFISTFSPDARKYLNLPFFCDIVSYGDNIVASVDKAAKEIVKAYIDKFPVEHCFETPNLHVLNDALQKMGMRICFMAEYFLPDVDLLKPLPCAYEIKMLEPNAFADFYTPQWANALCEKRRQLDVLAAAAFDNEKLIGLAGCSADCNTMWQIGVDVLPEHRKNGIAAALTSRLACEALQRGKVPYYCSAWSNIKSVRNAIKSGFKPAWVEVTAKSTAFIDEMNK